ncbi:thiamine-monophosphate kinase [Verrucomicrobiota bacterium]|nr:thiamine-monophosphate kinase [Verrucomicrobiota bacterium]
MKVSSLGEDAVVAALTRGLPCGEDVRLGAGDDCAVIGGARDRMWQLLKTDCVVEGVHFLAAEKPARIGWKAMCRAVSDIAAMGGGPRHALITIAVACDVKMAWLRGIYAGLRAAARRFGVSIVGGETSRSPGPAFISIALTGEVERTRCVTRGGGKAGDVLFVTGRLGGSLAGKHLDFIPRIAEARWLTANFKIRAMMDISDGLAADLPRLARASGCGFEICEETIPRNRGCTVAQALSDGEDFELLFAVRPADASRLEAQWRRKFPKLPLTKIGALRRRNADNPVHSLAVQRTGLSALRNSPASAKRRSTKPKPRGHDHFA